MKKELGNCQICNRRYSIDIDGVIAGHNKKGKKGNTIEDFCDGGHKSPKSKK
jgi:hypothetical protein